MFDKLLNIIGFDPESWKSYDPVVKNKFMYMYFKNIWLQLVVFICLDTIALLSLLPISVDVKFIYLLLVIPGVIVGIKQTKLYKNSRHFLSSKIGLIIGFTGVSLFIVGGLLLATFTAQVLYTNTGSYRLYLVIFMFVIISFLQFFHRRGIESDISAGNLTNRVIANKVEKFVETKLLTMRVLLYLREYCTVRLGFCTIFFFYTDYISYLWLLASVLPSFIFYLLHPYLILTYSNTKMGFDLLAEVAKNKLSLILREIEGLPKIKWLNDLQAFKNIKARIEGTHLMTLKGAKDTVSDLKQITSFYNRMSGASTYKSLVIKDINRQVSHYRQ